MKINQDIRIGLDKVKIDQKETNTSGKTFGRLVQKQDQKLHLEQLSKLLLDVGQAGERLSRSRNLKDLSKYKSLVKQFVKETVDFGMNLKHSYTWNQFGEGRKLKTIEMIDQELVQLSEDVINKEKESMDVLGRIGEIKGLLINLYT
ncbi:YaaR family protein [Bacillus sp. 2205SS5-2]|uniref:YaaR family protein n=1 Tax=Bacillus sp. 2205SS5-2 TaxID=3109031 RepID=UPI003003B117